MSKFNISNYFFFVDTMLLQSKSSPPEIEELLKLIKSNPAPREMQRALAVKLVKSNYSYSQIQQILNVSIEFISKWNNEFFFQVLEGLKIEVRISPSSWLSNF